MVMSPLSSVVYILVARYSKKCECERRDYVEMNRTLIALASCIGNCLSVEPMIVVVVAAIRSIILEQHPKNS